jgi:hypothetical protein
MGDKPDRKRKSFTRYSLLALAIGCFGSAIRGEDSYPEDLSKWRAIEGPDSHYWGGTDWRAFLRDGRPAARVRKRTDNDRTNLPFKVEGDSGIYATKISDGWLVAFNHGEWGTEVWWYAPDGTTRSLVSKDPVCGFVQSGQRVLAIEGLAHLRSNWGWLIEFTRGEDGKWKSKPLTDLKSAPKAAALDKDGTLIVLTTRRLLRVKLGSPPRELLNAFWTTYSPNSVVIDRSGAIFIGLEGFVAKITLQGDKPTVARLVPPPATAETRSKADTK